MKKDDGLLIFEFTCPECGWDGYHRVPEEGNEMNCPQCDWSEVAKEVVVEEVGLLRRLLNRIRP